MPSLPNDHIRLLFGLKLRQLRLDAKLSVSELANRSGLAVSYISEIEKGRKYPKADKIAALANALGAEYDTLVSLKLSKHLEPIADLLRSKFLTEIPLDLFGIDASDLLELLAEAPIKVSAMIRTLVDVAQGYNMSVERLYLTMLRSYQELHDNYFADIEAEADRFLAEFTTGELSVTDALLTNLLKTRYQIHIQEFSPVQRPELASVRAVFKSTTPTATAGMLHLNASLAPAQRLFVLAREVGFLHLNAKTRSKTYPPTETESFEQVLTNARASYFAGAVLIRRDVLIRNVTDFFAQPDWDNDRFLALIADSGATPEQFFYRLSNVLPQYFGIDQLFFYRFNHEAGQPTFKLTKEMHLSRTQGPSGFVDEHFCRRWVAITSLQELSILQKDDDFNGPLCRAQRSTYADTGQEFLIISVAHAYRPEVAENMSVSMCFAVNDTLRSQMAFLDSPALLHRTVNEACERCGLFDCRERVAAPSVLQKRRQAETLKQAVETLI